MGGSCGQREAAYAFASMENRIRGQAGRHCQGCATTLAGVRVPRDPGPLARLVCGCKPAHRRRIRLAVRRVLAPRRRDPQEVRGGDRLTTCRARQVVGCMNHTPACSNSSPARPSVTACCSLSASAVNSRPSRLVQTLSSGREFQSRASVKVVGVQDNYALESLSR
jgi:hypothetical protein